MTIKQKNELVHDFQQAVLHKMVSQFKWTNMPAHQLDSKQVFDDAIELIELGRKALAVLDGIKEKEE